jgi:hypothetical protein
MGCASPWTARSIYCTVTVIFVILAILGAQVANYGITVTLHLIQCTVLRLRASTALLFKRLRPPLAWFEVAPGQALDASEKAIISERPANVLGGAQPLEQIRFGLAGKQIGEVRKTILDRCQRGQSVILAAQMRARARPPPALRPFDQPRPHRIERHIAQCRREVLLVHGDGAESALPEMSAAFAARLDDAGIGAMHARQRTAQPVGIGRHQDKVHVVRHQAPGPHLDPGGTAILGEQVAIKRMVGVTEEGARAAIAALGDVVRVTGNDDTGEAGHAA